MPSTPSWRAVADALAERMSHYAICKAHPEAEADPDCPFCKDRAAYRMWERKSGQTFVTREAPGEVVDVFALARSSYLGGSKPSEVPPC